MAAAAGAAALEVGFAVDLTRVGTCAVLETVLDTVLDTGGVTDTGGLAAPVDETAGLVAPGLGGGAVTVGDVWLLGGALDCFGVLAVPALGVLALAVFAFAVGVV